MLWIVFGLISSLFLGLYDVCKKHAFNHNAVREPDALIVVLSILRRSSAVIFFAAGSLLFGDVNRRARAWARAGGRTGVI